MLRITMTSGGELPMACILLRCIELVAPFSGTDRVIVQAWTWQDHAYKLAHWKSWFHPPSSLLHSDQGEPW